MNTDTPLFFVANDEKEYRLSNKITLMNPLRLLVIAIIFICITLPQITFAQDNLRVNYTSSSTIPDFLNVCGDTDEVSITIAVNGGSTSDRENISAIANLFNGVTFAGFNAAGSSAGVTYETITSTPGAPVFLIPNLSPLAVTSVDISFFIQADCGVIDTLNQNNSVSVFDEWETLYTIDGTASSELQATAEYRDAFAVPFFSIDLTNNSGPFRVGDCFDRVVTVSNSGLDGFVDTLIYTVTQGGGASIQTINVNGIDMPVMKTLDVNGDTLVTVAIGPSEFAMNTAGGGASNGDGFIDPNETVTITESLCVANCIDNRSSNHVASWGCYGSTCSSVDITDFVRIGDGAANPEIETSGLNPTVNVGYCQDGAAAVTYTNNGVELDAGFATMLNIQLGIGLGTNFMLADNGYSITSYNIGGVDIPITGTTITLDNNPLFSTDPDGPGGLVDFDGDGFFDDLELTESIEIALSYEVDCSLAQGTADNCVNDFSSFLTARVTYSDACGEGIVNTENGFIRPSNVNSDIEDFSSPDAFSLGDVFYVTHTESRSVRLFEKNCGGEEIFRATVILPTGISNVIAETTLIKNESTVPIPLLSNTVSGDTLILTFDASLDAFINGNYELQLAFQADCDAEIGPSTFPTTFEFVCPPCGCEHLWYCSDIQGPFIHKDIPPCPIDPVAICPSGFKATGFDVNRTTYGFTDANYTTKIDPASANRKVAVSCDSVEMIVSGVVGETDIAGTIGFNIDYSNADGTTDAGEIFNFNGGMVRVNQGGTDFFCPVAVADMVMTANGAAKNIRIELPNCLSDLGLTLNPGDSIQFIGDFALNPDGPYEVQFKKVPDFRAYPFAVVGGVDEFCETFGDNFTVAKTNTLFAFPNSNNFPEGCEETFLNYQVISVFNDFPAFYGNEFYPSIKVDSIKFVFDTEILNSFDVVEPYVSIPGHPIHGNDFFPVPGFETTPSGFYAAYFDTLNIVPSLNEVRSYSFNFRVRLIPNCESLLGSSGGDNTFNFDPEIFYQNRYYAETVSDPSCVEFVSSAIDNDVTYTNPPTFSYNTTTNPNFILTGDTASWTVRLCNNSTDADAGITWLALDNIDEDVIIQQIVDLSDPLNPDTLSFTSYGTTGNNVFTFSDGVDRAVGTTAPEDLCNTYEILATVTSCGDLDVIARTGWACQAITDPLWTPEDYPPCDAMELPLSITTRDPFLDADVEVQPLNDLDICDVNSVTIRLKNTDLGAAFDLTSQFILPDGLILVPGSVEFAYPASSAFVPVAVDPVLLPPTTFMGNIYEYATFADLSSDLDLNGLPGDDLDPATDDSEFLIRFETKTDCDFRSGSVMFFNFQALLGCNGPSNLEAGETVPINIDGTLSGTVKLFDIAITGGTALVPEEQSDLEVTVGNLTNEPTAGDQIEISLPEGVTYVPGSTTTTQPTTWAPGEPSIETIGALEILTWPLADGMLISDQAVLRFSVNTTTQACDVTSLDGLLLVLSGQNFVCSDDGSVCASNAITSTNGGQLVQFPVRQGLLTFDVSSTTSVCASPTTEMVTITGNIINGDMDFPAGTFDVEYFNDLDESGSVDATDVLLGTFSVSGPILANATVPFTHTYEAAIADVCNIILYADVSAITMNGCGETVMSIDQPRILNAGADQVICNNEAISTFELGDANCDPTAYTYSWTSDVPANTANLSALDIPNPVFTINMADLSDPNYTYILLTTRPGCTATRDTVVMNVSAAPVITASADTPTACPGTPVALTAMGAVTYEWFDGATSAGTGDVISVTPMGNTTYLVIGTDANGCENSATVDIVLDVAVCPCNLAQVTSVLNNASNCGESIGSATINIAENPADYNFVWTPNLGTDLGATRTDLPFGGYFISIEEIADANCTTDTYALIQNADGPQATVFTTPATCNAPDGTATLTPVNFTYEWSNDGFVGATRSDLTSGVYFVTITDPADPTCQNALAVVIGEDNPLEAEATIIAQPDCGVSNGEASIAVTGGSGVYTYTWFDGFEGSTRNDLAGGIYVVTIVDQDITGCELPFIFIITDDVPQGDVDITSVNDISCFGLTDGGIDYTVSYDPLFTNPADTLFSNGTSTFTNGALPAGSYCIQINDGNGCVAGGDCFTIIEPDLLTLQVDATSDCIGSGILAVTAIGGTGPYTFDWADLTGSDNGSFRQNLSAGSYDITVSDANDCSTSITGIEVLPCACNIAQVTSVVNSASNCGESIGSATINIDQDPANYNFVWTPDVGTDLGATRTDLPFGGYFISIEETADANCTTDTYALIQNADGPQATVFTTPATCNAPDGTATLTPANFTYEWSNDGFVGATRSDLTSGVYFVTITDPADPTCQNALAVVIGEDNPLEAEATIIAQPDCGVSNGEASVAVTGGSGVYTFTWFDGFEGSTRNDLAAGIYVVTIVDQDVSACELPFIFIITDNVPQGDVSITSVNDISCFGMTDGGIDYTVSYDPLFTNPADTLFSNGTYTFSNGALPAGSYCIQINDGNGCVAGGDCFTIVEPDLLTLQVDATADCNGNGILAVTAIGGTAPYTFDWADLPGSDNSSFRQNLNAGSFNIAVSDANDCGTSITGIEVLACSCESVEITSVLVLEATCGQPDGYARVGLVGDPSLYTYTWTPDLGTPGIADNERSELQAGEYTVEISGGSGACVDEVTFLVTSIGGLDAMVTTTPASCDAADGTATLSPDTYSYTWPAIGGGAPVISETRSDLPAGSYIVTITDGADACPGIMEVVIGVNNPLLADVTVTTQPDCGESNGEVTINPTGITGPFEFLWADGDTTATRSDLSSGLYVVTITEAAGSGCELPFLFVLTDNVPPATVTINGVDSVSCAGNSDGGLDFSINFDAGFTPPADTIFSDGFFVYENGSMPIGNYCITIIDGNGCVAGGECFEVVEPDELELLIVITEDCNGGGSADVNISGGTEPYIYDWSDLTGTDDMEDRTGLLADTITLTVTDVNGCSVREDEVIIPECTSIECDFFNGQDTIVFFATECDGLQEICFDEIRLEDLLTYEISIDDIPYSETTGDCNILSSPSYQIDIIGDPGPFELVSWSYNDSLYMGNFSTTDELLTLMNSIDTNSLWVTSDISVVNIVGGNPDNDYGDIMMRSLATGTEFTPSVDFTLRPFGSYMLIDTGYHQVVFLDTIQMCSDTVTVFVDPSMLLCDVVFDTIMPLDTVVYCIDTAAIDIFTGPIVSAIDICPESNGNNVSFTIDEDYCVTYAGITLGVDTACIALCDAAGNCDTTNFIITVVSDPEIVQDTIFPGDMETFCLDVSIFEGQTFTIDNFCPEDADGQVDFLIDPVTNCIEYFGNEIGIDSACIAICDDLGFCDTTFFYIVVDSIDGAPIAVNDADTTIINTPIVLDIKGNDILNGTLDTVFLISDPIYGEVSINLDCSLTYDPDTDFCDVTDNFDYVICNPLGCDTATVSIYIDCEGEIVIYTAVSPNGDGVNDFFHVGGIGAFPNNRLCIFNRWGNQVLLKDGYNNEFNGRWENKDLPDGTYFYILELNDVDNRSFKGSFEMYR